MTISIIVAKAKNGIIGRDNSLPWNIPEDMSYFKEKTLGKSVVMGKKTFDSIGRALPGRKNIVLNRNKNSLPNECFSVQTIEEAISIAGDGEIMIIGGASVYKQFIPMADRIYFTIIDQDFEGDCFFPEINEKDWVEISRVKGRGDKGLKYDFVILERLKNKKDE